MGLSEDETRKLIAFLGTAKIREGDEVTVDQLYDLRSVAANLLQKADPAAPLSRLSTRHTLIASRLRPPPSGKFVSWKPKSGGRCSSKFALWGATRARPAWRSSPTPACTGAALATIESATTSRTREPGGWSEPLSPG